MARINKDLLSDYSDKKSNLLTLAYDLLTGPGLDVQVLVFLHHDEWKPSSFCTVDFQPVLCGEAGKKLIQSCLDKYTECMASSINDPCSSDDNMLIEYTTQVTTRNSQAAAGSLSTEKKSHLLEKARELSAIRGTHVLVLIMDYQTGELFSVCTKALEPVVASDAGKSLLKSCVDRKAEDRIPRE